MKSKLFITTTQYLIDFLNTHISHKLDCFQYTKFSVESKKILNLLFDRMITAEKSFYKTKITEKEIKTIPKGRDYHLLDEVIKTHIEKMEFIGKNYSFNINSRKVKVNLICENTTSFSFDSAIKKIYIWLHVAMSFSKSECSQLLNINFYLTILEKTLPHNYSVIERINANTGFTFSCSYENEINIYRYEEWFKVFIHETFHNMGLDFSHHECSQIHKKIMSIFPISLDVRIYETYCETWSEIINVMFIGFQLSDHNNLVKTLEKFMDYERMFSLFQCAKILKHFGLNYKQLYEKTDSAHMARKIRYNEKTPVLSYYIIKSFLMYKINHFLEWCVTNNELSIRFNDLDANKTMNSYFLLIEKHYQDEKYIECIDKLCHWYTKQEKTKRSSDIEFKTLRMSLFEL
jgi:hypothetical protein